jgi:hypothetical protein
MVNPFPGPPPKSFPSDESLIWDADLRTLVNTSVPDPQHFDTDPDPWIRTLDSRCEQKKVFKDNKLLKSNNTVEIEVFLYLIAC